MKKLMVVTFVLALVLTGCKGAKKPQPQVGLKETLHTKYFDVTVNEQAFYNSLKIGEFIKLPDEEGTDYFVINVTLKNTSDESRMLTDGKVVVETGGKSYNFDKSEHIMSKGFGLTLKQINPLTSITTNLVYKVPSDVKGSFYYNPTRSDEDERIFLGAVK